ncbi:hypothetical protein CBL_03458 [Carabus blaptoides fortunei]
MSDLVGQMEARNIRDRVPCSAGVMSCDCLEVYRLASVTQGPRARWKGVCRIVAAVQTKSVMFLVEIQNYLGVKCFTLKLMTVNEIWTMIPTEVTSSTCFRLVPHTVFSFCVDLTSHHDARFSIQWAPDKTLSDNNVVYNSSTRYDQPV